MNLLTDLLDQAADWWHSSAKQKGLRLVVSLDRGLPRRITAGPVRLQQVLNNFLGNAVKFTSEGAITLRVSERAGPRRRGDAPACRRTGQSSASSRPRTTTRTRT
jgi:two-component system, sensor histidine kinase RetS